MAEFIVKTSEDGKRYTLQVRGARLRFKNFGGRPTQFVPEGGIRTVNMDVDDPDVFEMLANDDWRFRTPKRPDGTYADPFEELEDGRISIPHTQLKLNFRSERPPKVYLHNGDDDRRGTLLNEDAVGELDYAYISKANLVVNPYHWESAGGSGTKGYINILHAYIEEDPFAEPDIDDVEDEVPFR